MCTIIFLYFSKFTAAYPIKGKVLKLVEKKLKKVLL